jgi:hypothetical protein
MMGVGIAVGIVVKKKSKRHETPKDETGGRAAHGLTWPLDISLSLASTGAPMQSSALSTGAPRSSERRGTTGFRLNLGSGPLLGRPCGG